MHVVADSFDAFAADADREGLAHLVRRLQGCRVDVEATVFNVEIIPAREHPEASRRHDGEMHRLLLMSPSNEAGAAYDVLPPDRRLMLAVPEGGEGVGGIARGDRIRVRATVHGLAEGDWSIVWVRNPRIERLAP